MSHMRLRPVAHRENRSVLIQLCFLSVHFLPIKNIGIFIGHRQLSCIPTFFLNFLLLYIISFSVCSKRVYRFEVKIKTNPCLGPDPWRRADPSVPSDPTPCIGRARSANLLPNPPPPTSTRFVSPRSSEKQTHITHLSFCIYSDHHVQP